MQILISLRLIFLFLMGFSLSMFTPLIVVFAYHETDMRLFIYSGVFTFFVGLIGYLCLRRFTQPLNNFGGFFVVTVFWISFSFFAALPFFLSMYSPLDFTSALFETVSGFTTSSVTTLTNLDQFPKSLLFYRQQLEFFGGMGMVTLAIALMPSLNTGAALKLYLPEDANPNYDESLIQEPTDTLIYNIRLTWILYAVLTIVCAVAYWIAGMQPLDAVGMSFSSVSTGGFVMYDANFAYFNHLNFMIIAEIFMLIGALNFNLHLKALRARSLKPYWQDTETRVYFALIITVILFTLYMLDSHHFYANTQEAIKQTTFNVISIMTTTGYMSAPYASWPSYIPYLLMMAALIGTAGNSTGGGLKILRFWLVLKCIYAELQNLVQPTFKNRMRVSGKHVDEMLIRGILAFFCVYIAWIAVTIFWLIDLGLDLHSAFGAVVACLSNVGLGIGQYAYNFHGIGHPAEWLLMITMIAGRLEIFALLVLFMPSLWELSS